MVDLGEGARGVRFDEDRPDGYAPGVAAADSAELLLALSVWPRYVQLVSGCDRVPVARVRGRVDDPPGSVRLSLERRDGTLATFLGAGEVCVAGPLPSRWWGWRTRDGAPVLSPDPPSGRDAESLVYDADDPALDDPALRDPALAVTFRPGGPWWDEQRLAGREWVATFEGERDAGATADPGPAGAEREALLHTLECAVLGVGGYNAPRIAEACLDALLADPAAGHVQCGGEADPDDVLVEIVEGVDASYSGGADAAGVVQTALSVLRRLDAAYTIHPRPDTP